MLFHWRVINGFLPLSSFSPSVLECKDNNIMDSHLSQYPLASQPEFLAWQIKSVFKTLCTFGKLELSILPRLP